MIRERVDSISALVDAYTRSKQEDFQGVKEVEYINGNARYQVIVDKRTEIVEKLYTLGITELWDDCSYHLPDGDYNPATFVITQASMDEADELITILMQSKLKVRYEMYEVYSNTPRQAPCGVVKGINAHGVKGGPVSQFTNTAKINDFHGRIGAIIDSVVLKKVVSSHDWDLKDIQAPQRIKEVRLLLDKSPIGSLFSDTWPKVDLNPRDYQGTLFDSADIVTVDFMEEDRAYT